MLENQNALPILSEIRKTVRFIRKSSVDLLHMKSTFENSYDFKYALLPFLDVKTRWCYTLVMCKQHLKIHDVVKGTQQSMLREQGAQSASSIELLSAEETIIIEDLMMMLQNTEDVTEFLGKSNSPSIQDVDIFTATINCSFNEFVDPYLPISSILREFLDDIMKLLVALLNQFPIIDHIFQVSPFLAP